MYYTLLFESLLVLIFTYLLLKIFILNAKRFGLIDIPNGRSSHNVPIARGAGIVFGFIFLVAVISFYFTHWEDYNYFYVFISFLIIYIIGIYDDFVEIRSREKFLFIIIATMIAYYDGFSITTFGNYFGYELTLGYFALPFTIFAVVGFTNALNLTDGLDGLAGSISIVILSSLLYVGASNNDQLLIFLPVLLINALSVFLFFNWPPAKVFMGDSGSLFLGFTIALLSIYSLKYVTPTSILFLAAIPLLDTLIVMRRRRQRKQPLFVADKNHIHHMLFNLKKDTLFTVRTLIKMQIVFGLVFVQVYDKPDAINLILFVTLFITFFKLFDPRLKHRNNKKIIK